MASQSCRGSARTSLHSGGADVWGFRALTRLGVHPLSSAGDARHVLPPPPHLTLVHLRDGGQEPPPRGRLPSAPGRVSCSSSVASLCPMLTSTSGATLPVRIAIACPALPLLCKLLRSRKALSLSALQCTQKSLKIYLLNANARGEEGRLGGRTEKTFRAAQPRELGYGGGVGAGRRPARPDPTGVSGRGLAR